MQFGFIMAFWVIITIHGLLPITSLMILAILLKMRTIFMVMSPSGNIINDLYRRNRCATRDATGTLHGLHVFERL